MLVELSLNEGVKLRNLTTSSVLHSLHDTGGSPPWLNNPFFLSGVYREFGAKIIEIKVAEKNAPLKVPAQAILEHSNNRDFTNARRQR